MSIIPNDPADMNCSNLQEDGVKCANCIESLCLREKTINLALGHTEIMYCLICLGKIENKNPEEILAKTKRYIMARECFQKEWVKYTNISDCPKVQNCFPKTCFDK